MNASKKARYCEFSNGDEICGMVLDDDDPVFLRYGQLVTNVCRPHYKRLQALHCIDQNPSEYWQLVFQILELTKTSGH